MVCLNSELVRCDLPIRVLILVAEHVSDDQVTVHSRPQATSALQHLQLYEFCKLQRKEESGWTGVVGGLSVEVLAALIPPNNV